VELKSEMCTIQHSKYKKIPSIKKQTQRQKKATRKVFSQWKTLGKQKNGFLKVEVNS